MSKQPMGKTLLRNVIRHTDAHNKIQEEMEMWKMRDWEVQMSHHKHLSAAECRRGSMHCDRVSDESRDLSRSRERFSDHDDREARYWTRKLYEFEANDPDRWGHSGFKELYPEEFDTNREGSDTKKIGRLQKKESKAGKESISKQPKKSSRKKKKKKKKRKNEEGKPKKEETSSSEHSSDESTATKGRHRRKRTKSRHKNKKNMKSRGRDSDSSSEDSDNKEDKERHTHSGKKRKQDSHKDLDSGPESEKKRRKNWKVAGEESSDASSGD